MSATYIFVPLALAIMPLGSLNVAAVPTPSAEAVVTDAAPLPARVLTVHEEPLPLIMRIRLFTVSGTYTIFPVGFTAIPWGLLNVATVPAPSK